MFTGKIENEFGEVVGSFWYRPSSMTYSWTWCKIRRDGWTLEGLQEWADSLGYYLVG